MKRTVTFHLIALAFLVVFSSMSGPACFAQETKKPVLIGLDGEIGHLTSTSDDAIKIGISIAIDEINSAGGVLGGRPLELIVRDNRSVPARGIANIEEFSKIPDLVAVFGGKFSPVMIEEIPILHEKKMILLNPWGAADIVIDNGQIPNFCFRLSLRDSWAIRTMMEHAIKKGAKRIGVLLPVTGWGRSNDKAIQKYLADHSNLILTESQWYHWGDKSLVDKYKTILRSGAEAILLIANEAEGSILVKEIAELPAEKRLPLISHWGVSGGDFTKLTGEAITKVDLSLVQTYSFFDNRREEKLRRFYRTAERLYSIKGPEDIHSPVGTAHAYDLTHILAKAVDLAGSTDREAIRNALEQVRDYDGLIKHYPQPFTPERHEALIPEDLFMGYFRTDGAILRIAD